MKLILLTLFWLQGRGQPPNPRSPNPPSSLVTTCPADRKIETVISWIDEKGHAVPRWADGGGQVQLKVYVVDGQVWGQNPNAPVYVDQMYTAEDYLGHHIGCLTTMFLNGVNPAIEYVGFVYWKFDDGKQQQHAIFRIRKGAIVLTD